MLRRIVLLSTLIIITATLLSPTVLYAFYRLFPSIHSNFQHTPQDANNDLPSGLPLAGRAVLRGSTTIANIDGNASNGQEIIVGGSDGILYAYRQNATLLWQVRVAPNCVPDPSYGLINTAPAVGNLFGDGRAYVVVGYGTIVKNASCAQVDDGGVAAIDGATGQVRWNFNTPFDNMDGFNLNAVSSSPALDDTDGDGRLEVGFGSQNNNVYLLNADGSLRWRYRAFDTMFSSPSFYDTNGDGRKELLIATAFAPVNNTPKGKFPNTYGWLYAFDPTPQPDGLHEFGEGYLWATPLDQSTDSQPVVTDLDGDGAADIMIGASPNNPNNVRWIKLFDAASGRLKTTITTPGFVWASQALADLNSDGRVDIVAAVDDPNGGREGRVIAYSGVNFQPLWSVVPQTPVSTTGGFGQPHNFSPIVADLDGNGSLEVIVTVEQSVAVLRGDNGQQLTSTCSNGPQCNRRAMYLWRPPFGTPAVADIDNDGKLELAIGGGHTLPAYGDKGFLYVYRDFDTFLGSPQGNAPRYSAPWPMFHGSPQHTGRALPRSLTVPVRSFNALVTPRRNASFNVPIGTTDGSALNWTASKDDPDNVVQFNRTSGSNADALVVTIATDSAKAGQRKRSTASITIRADGLQPVTIPVTAVSGQNRFDANVPLVRR